MKTKNEKKHSPLSLSQKNRKFLFARKVFISTQFCMLHYFWQKNFSSTFFTKCHKKGLFNPSVIEKKLKKKPDSHSNY